AATFMRLSVLLPNSSFIPMPGLSDSLRWVKSEDEIAILRQASPIADKAMLEVARQARPGMTTLDAAAIASTDSSRLERWRVSPVSSMT
ncbi:hypothetical protein ACC723_37965, partial [Rhizobium ruizarguesonis]